MCEADARGRGPELRARIYQPARSLSRWFDAAAAVKLDPAALEGVSGTAIAARLREARVAAIRAARQEPTDT